MEERWPIFAAVFTGAMAASMFIPWAEIQLFGPYTARVYFAWVATLDLTRFPSDPFLWKCAAVVGLQLVGCLILGWLATAAAGLLTRRTDR